MKLPEETKRIIDSILAPYGLSLEQLCRCRKEEVKPSLDTVYLTVKQAEEYTHYSRWSLGRYAQTGEIKCIKKNKSKGGKVLFEKDSLDKWLHSR